MMNPGIPVTEQMNPVRKSFNTLRQMIKDRGWDITSFDTDPSLKMDTVVARIMASPMTMINVDSCELRVIWNMNLKFRTSDVKKLLQDPPSWTILIIADMQSPISLSAITEPKTSIEALRHSSGRDSQPKTSIEFFRLSEIQTNISHHVKVPKHIPIRDEGMIKRIMEDNKVNSRYQMPIIKSSDAMAKYLALRPGQLVKIIRNSPSAGTYVTYRCCMKD